MSKKSKSLRAMKRRELKRRAKEARRAQYKKFAEEGKKRGTKRGRKANKQKRMKTAVHSFNCGNIGCIQCNPKPYNLPPLWKQLLRTSKKPFWQIFQLYMEHLRKKARAA